MTTSTESLIRRTMVRDMPNGSRIVANVEVRLPGESRGLSPAFSVTGEVYEQHGTWNGAARHRNGRESDIGGCIHDEILRAFPELAPVVALHLSDPETGEPMHAESNGWYWYAGSRADLRATERYTGFSGIYAHQLEKRGLSDDDSGREDYCYQVACKTLQVSEIPRFDSTFGSTATRAAFSAFVDDQRDRWRQEAADARALVESLPEYANEDRETYTEKFDHGLSVRAALMDENGYRPGVGAYHQFRVVVSAPTDTPTGRGGWRTSTYSTVYGASVADFDAGRIDAREAALDVLAEMIEFLDQSAAEMAEEFGMDMDDPSAEERETFRKMQRCERAADRLSNSLEPNRELLAR